MGLFSRNLLLKEYRLRLIEIEIELHKARHVRGDNRIQRYFNSTPLRNVFSRICVYAKCVNEFYTISQISYELRATRQSVSQMVDECEEEGWVNVDRTPNRVGVQASQSLYDGMLDYTKERKRLAKDVIKWKWNYLATMSELVETDLTLFNDDTVKSDDIDNKNDNYKINVNS